MEAFVEDDLPRRFNRFTAQVSIPAVRDAALAAELLERAERLCTVSHTVGAESAREFEPGAGECHAR